MKRANRELKGWRWHRSISWSLGVTVVALAPKCLLCVVAYLGIGAAMGLKSYELCGASPKGFANWEVVLLGVGHIRSYSIPHAAPRLASRVPQAIDASKKW